MPRYIEVIHATHETATKILALRGTRRIVTVTTEGGHTASVNWSDRSPAVTLNMPTLPADSVLTRAEADRLVAFIAHECCHVLHTNRRDWLRACASGDRVRLWTNCLEDVRIEATEIKAGAFPAMRSLLSTMCNHLHIKSRAQAVTAGVTIGARVTDAPFVASVLGRMANSYAIPAADQLRGDMSPRVARLVNHALAGVKQCKGTSAVVNLALELVAMEQAQAQQPQPQQPPQDGQDAPGEPQDGQDGQDTPGAPQEPQEPQDGQDGQDAPGEPQEGQDGQDAPGEPQDSQDGQDTPGAPQDSQDGQDAPGEPQDGQDGQDAPGEPQDGQDGQGGQDAPGEPQDGQGDNGQDDGQDDGQGDDGQDDGQGDDSHGEPVSSGDADLTDTVDTIAKRAGINDLEDYAQEDRSHALSTVRSVIDTGDQSAGGSANCVKLLNNRLPRNSILHGQISRLLVSEEKHRHTHHETTGRLDRRALVRMRAGAVDVFTQQDDTPGMDTALLIMIDGSSSMREMAGTSTRMGLAQTTAWHIARAAEAANARVCVTVFHTPRDLTSLQARKSGGMTGAAITVIKPWAVAMADRARQLNDIEPTAWTPLSPAILAGADMLADISATRHILMVLTDGECDYGAPGVTTACRLAEEIGVETVGIGMDCEEVTAAFPPRYSVNVSDLTQLASTGLDVLVRMLEDANPRGGAN